LGLGLECGVQLGHTGAATRDDVKGMIDGYEEFFEQVRN